MSRAVVPIVEGKGDERAVRILLRKLLHERATHYHISVARPIRVPRDKLLKPEQLERYVELAPRTRDECGAILILIDADDDCPAELGPSLATRAGTVTQFPTLVVIAKAEFESWFVGSIESLRGIRGIAPSAEAPSDPESIRDAKGWIGRLMPGTQTYKAPDDQPSLTAQFDLDLAAKRCPSFERLCIRLEELVERVQLERPDKPTP